MTLKGPSNPSPLRLEKHLNSFSDHVRYLSELSRFSFYETNIVSKTSKT